MGYRKIMSQWRSLTIDLSRAVVGLGDARLGAVSRHASSVVSDDASSKVPSLLLGTEPDFGDTPDCC